MEKSIDDRSNGFYHKDTSRWAAVSCRHFALAVSNGELPIKGRRFQFWMHWVICPFCRRYWKEIRAIGRLHQANNVLADHPVIKLGAVKQRLKDQMRARFS